MLVDNEPLTSKSKLKQNFCIWGIEPKTKEFFVSANAEEVFGFPVGVEGMLATVHPDDLAPLTDKLRRALEGLEPLHQEIRHIHPVTGEVSWFLVEGQLVHTGAAPRFTGVAHNITRQKLAAEKLLISEEQFRAFFENAGVGTAQLDLDLYFIRVNEHFCQITGYSREELLNMTPMDLDHPEEREVDRERFRRLFENKERVYVVEKRYVRKDGRVVWVHVTGTVVRDAADNPLQIVAIIKDITGRKESEEQIRQQHAVLEGINRILREALTCRSEEEYGRVCLQVAEGVTGSKCGFIGEVNALGLLDFIAISDQDNTTCKIKHYIGPPGLVPSFKTHGIYGRVIRDGKPVLTNDPGSHPDSIGTPPEHTPIRAFLGVPLRDQGKTVGMIAVGNREGGYRNQDLAALEALSEPMVQGLMRWRANKQLAEDYAALTRLHEVSIQFDDNINTFLHAVLEAAIDITRADCGTIQLLDDQTGELYMLATNNTDQRVLAAFGRVSANSGTSCAEALRHKQRVIVADYQTDERFAHHLESTSILLAAGIHASQSTPLILRTGRLIGMFSTHWGKPGRPADRVLRLVDLLARQAADQVEHKQAVDNLRQSEERYRALAQDLQLADRRKDEFIGVLSHEIRNPLTAIKLGLSLLDRSSPAGEQTVRVREIINRQVVQLSRLIDELLDVTRIARNKIALQKGQVELGALVRRAAEDYQALFQERCLQLEVSCSPVALHMEADAVRLAQVVGNLLHNAAKFTPSGGGARVMVAKDEAGQSALISIKDSGLGIESEMPGQFICALHAGGHFPGPGPWRPRARACAGQGPG